MISTLGRAAKLGGQRGWKLFAFFAVLLAWYGIADAGTINAVQIVDLAIEVLAASGLVLMAFEIDFLPGRFGAGSLAPILPMFCLVCRESFHHRGRACGRRHRKCTYAALRCRFTIRPSARPTCFMSA
jgi:hypothetical protein